MQASNFIQGLSRPDFYSQLLKLRLVMADKKMSMWTETEAAQPDEPAPNTHFLFSLLEALYDDKVCDAAKSQLLILIEEHFDAFITTPTVASQLVHSMLGIASHAQEFRGRAPPNSHGFILQCVTAIVVRYDLVRLEPDLCERFVQTLLDLLCLVQGDSVHARFRAIVSLEHLEQRYPSFLMWKLEQLAQVCGADTSILFEHCVRLFAMALRNAVDHCVMCEGRWNPDLFNLRTESLRHCQLDFDAAERLRQFDPACAVRRCLTNLEGPLVQHLHFCLDRTKFLSFWSLVAVFDSLVRVVARFDGLEPALFKPIVLRAMPLNMPRLLFSMLRLRLVFRDGLYPEHARVLLHTCLSHMNNSRNSIPHRLLTAHWLAHHAALLADERRSVNERALAPTVFDPLDVKYAKMLFLNSFLEADSGGVLLLTNIIGVRKLSQYAGPGRVTSALFQMLFQLFVRRHASPLAQDVAGLVLGITKENADFVPYTLDFVDAVRARLPASPLPARCAADLSDWACAALPDLLGGPAAMHHLRVLAHAVRQPGVALGPVVEVLLQLLADERLCAAGDWATGSALLDVCRAVLEHRPEAAAGAALRGLGEVLGLVGRRFNDLDVRQRAELYYSMLVHLSGPRLQALLASAQPRAAGEVALRRTDGYPALVEVHALPEPVLAARNLPLWTAGGAGARIARWEPDQDGDAAAFLAFVRSEVRALPLRLALSRTAEGAALGLLLGVEVACHSSCPALGVTIAAGGACAALEADAELEVDVEVAGPLPDAFCLAVSASFATADGAPALGRAAPLRLGTMDLLLPLPAGAPDARLVANELRAEEKLLHAFMTLALSGRAKERLLEALEHLRVDEGHYCGLLLPDSHVLLDVDEKDDGLLFVAVAADRAPLLRQMYRYLAAFGALGEEDDDL